ncbi:DUF551 domain-containing protein [Enterobacter hormaechei]|uniref:DUF551 domain-containing protein n=1 Tax=Enterobacter cloacae complex TaxID=354276 RepID=UPI002FF15061
MSNIDKHDVQAVADLKAGYTLGHADVAILNELARIALASLEAEPVCVIDQSNLDYLKSGADADVWPASRTEMGDVLLYRTAPPAPVSVPAAMEMDDDFDSAFEHGKAVGWNACRAAMLQGADGALTNEDTMPTMLFKPVADLYGLTSPTGSETSFTFDAVEARDFVDGGWSCQEYVELERFQEAVSGNSPVTPDGWVACSEQMPEDEQEVIVQNKMGYRYVSYFDEHSGLFFDMRGGNQMNCIEHIFVTHWMPLPAAPQQED